METSSEFEQLAAITVCDHVAELAEQTLSLDKASSVHHTVTALQALIDAERQTAITTGRTVAPIENLYESAKALTTYQERTQFAERMLHAELLQAIESINSTLALPALRKD